MKVLFISTSSIGGGAFIAAARIYKSIRDHGVDAKFLSSSRRFKARPFPPGTLNYRPYQRLILSRFSRLQINLAARGPVVNRSLNRFESGLASLINRSDFDLIHMHWINDEMISIREIGAIRKPIVWTLHDMWAFCGSEHLNYQNDRMSFYSLGYDKQSNPLDYNTWLRKRSSWQETQFNLVTPSNWLGKQASDSLLFRDQIPVVIPNVIDP